MANQFQVGNQVRIKTSDGSPGETLYEITEFLPRCGCMIREYSSDPTVVYRAQRWDTGLLVHAVTDEMLKAFSMGPLKAGRRVK